MGQVVTVETCYKELVYTRKNDVGFTLPVFIKQQFNGHVHAPFRVLRPVDLPEATGSDLHKTLQTVITNHKRRKADLTGHRKGIYSTPALSVLSNSLEFKHVMI